VLGVSKLDKTRAAVAAIRRATKEAAGLQDEFDRVRAQVGGLESRHVAALCPGGLGLAEFKVFSQFGEDGIIQFLVQRVPIENEVFIEFGVEDYRESNTRFLLVHDNWRGLVMDGGKAHSEFLRASGLAWRHQIDAKRAWVDRDNVNDLIRDAGIEGDIGLLSIDIDGNDYWVFEAIDVVSPRILVLEYNSVFGPEAAVTVPYDPTFVRSERHWSWLYWGASLAALARAAERKGLALVGSNKAGNNAFFVRRDLLGDIPELPIPDAWRPSRFRESRGCSGELTYLSTHDERLRLLADMPVFDLDAGREVTIARRFGLS
jgi:hypothetical protein